VVQVGGLTRTDASGGFDEEFAGLVTALEKELPPVPEDDRENLRED
jgi:hypothetical protein